MKYKRGKLKKVEKFKISTVGRWNIKKKTENHGK